MTDRGPTVINTGRSSNTGWAVAVILAVVVIGGLLMFTGVINIGGSGGGTDVNVNVPAVETPSTDAKPATTETKPATETPATSTDATKTTTP